MLRPLVERLIRKDFRPQNLDTIILGIRSKTDGRKAIRDIGDFVAHRESRFRGVIAEETQEWFHLARSTAYYLQNPIDLNNVHPDFLPSLEITLARMKKKFFQKEIGASYESARRLLKDIATRSTNNDGKILVRINSQREFDLISKLASKLVIQPAFDDAKLFDEFIAVLRSQSLLAKNEVKSLEYLRPILSRYAVSLMHKCVVILKDKSRVELVASPNLYDCEINIVAAIDVSPVGQHPSGIKMACNIYTSRIDPAEACDPMLLSVSDWQSIHIEIAPDGKITILK